MDSYNKLRILALCLTCQVLIACATGSRSQHDQPTVPTLPSQTMIRVAADVVPQSEGEELHLAVTGSQPFSYQLGYDLTTSSLIMDIPQASFSQYPKPSPSGKAGLKHLRFVRTPGDESGARLHIEMEPQTLYHLTQEPQRLVVQFHSAPTALRGTLNTLPAPDRLTPSSAASVADYRVGPKDVLDITVYREPELSKHYRVLGPGTISFPMIGKVNVSTLTMAQIEQLLEDKLAQGYLMKPQVSVSVDAYKSQQVLVLGAVQKPGYYPLHGKTRLLEMLARAGGLKQENPQHQSIVVMRQHQNALVPPHEAATQTIRIDLHQLLSKGDISLSIPLQNEDVVLVPPPASIVIFGEVKNPGTFSLAKQTTLMEAISQSGGFTSAAASSRVRIVRTVAGIEKNMRVDVADIIKRGARSHDISLKPDDIIVVPTSVF